MTIVHEERVLGVFSKAVPPMKPAKDEEEPGEDEDEEDDRFDPLEILTVPGAIMLRDFYISL